MDNLDFSPIDGLRRGAKNAPDAMKGISNAINELRKTISDGQDGYEFMKRRLMEKYSISEAQAITVLKGQGVQRVITILAEENGLIDKASKWAITEAIYSAKEAEKRANEQNEKYLDAKRKLRPVEEERNELSKEQRELEESRREFEESKAEWQEKYEAQKREIQELQQLETAEARDRVRMAMIFKENVDGSQRSPQNQTVYIAGLASILANSPIWGQTRTKENSPEDPGKVPFTEGENTKSPFTGGKIFPAKTRGMPPKSTRTKD